MGGSTTPGRLDADDVLTPAWPAAFRALLEEWPAAAGVCFSACRDGAGRSTVARPGYLGPMTLDDALTERLAGEYMPLFRGDYIRARGVIVLTSDVSEFYKKGGGSLKCMIGDLGELV